jgi:hypothetical protein
MVRTYLCLGLIFVAAFPLLGQSVDGEFLLALPIHNGRLAWAAPGFKLTQSSVKPNGNEAGLRGVNASGKLTFLGFLFLFPEESPLTSAKCLKGVIEPMRKQNSKLKMTGERDNAGSGGTPVSLVSYEGRTDKGPLYSVRGFVATADVCGDLEFYGEKPIAFDDPEIKAAFASFKLDTNYQPKWTDVFVYAEILYRQKMYKPAGPMFELALTKLSKEAPTETNSRRVMIDEAGMSYGISGDTLKARAIFEKGIAEDPDYPLNYYNLACADAEEKKLVDAKRHLQQAFARKGNVIKGEKMPDPTQDDSFLPYKNNQEFWKFLVSLSNN